MFYGRRHGRKLRPKQAEYLERGMAEFGLDFNLPERAKNLDPRTLYEDRPDKVYLEIGFGGGEHLAAHALNNPKVGYIGAEPFVNGVASLCRHLAEGEIGNVRIWAEDIRLLLSCFKGGSFAGVYILFPDPWPKARHQSRRIVQPALLDELSRLLCLGGELLLASDDSVAKTWMLEQMMRRRDFSWTARGAQCWREPPADWIQTRYMTKANRAGRPSSWFKFIRISE